MTKSGKHCDKRRNCMLCAISSFCYYVFKKPSAAEASESVYMRERVKLTKNEGVLVTSHYQHKFRLLSFDFDICVLLLVK